MQNIMLILRGFNRCKKANRAILQYRIQKAAASGKEATAQVQAKTTNYENCLSLYKQK
jgi:hypothetical protein